MTELGSYVSTLDGPLAIDLFSGAGGTSLGLEKAGFEVILGVDLDEFCIATHQANFGGSSVRADLSLPREVDRIVEALGGIQVDLIAASPPCQPFSRAGRSKIRSLRRNGEAVADERRDLWRSLINMVERVAPRAVLVENVPGMIQGDDLFIVAEIIEHLEDLGFDVHARRLFARQHGVPQLRERIFIVGIERGTVFEWPRPARRSLTLEDAISDLPPVEGGSYSEFCEYGGPRTSFQRWARFGVQPDERQKVYDHFARAVRDDDLEAFRLMDHATKYSDLPEHLRRYRSDIFDDKYKRLHWNDVSRTITAHIAKDGYWYIHPEQHRTLTIREAARIQTFPDCFRFAGPPSHAFRQIGNAVPPLLAAAVGRQILKALRSPERQPARLTTRKLSALLAAWIEPVAESEMAQPWRNSGSLWQTLLGMILFERAKPAVVRNFWPTYSRRWDTPQRYLTDTRREAAARAIGRGGSSELLARIARVLTGLDEQEFVGEKVEGLSQERLAYAATLSGIARAFQPTPQTVRIAERVSGEGRGGSRVDDQLALVRFIGTTHTGQAYGALLEVGDRFCRPTAPQCRFCPLRTMCATGQKRTKETHPVLFSAYD